MKLVVCDACMNFGRRARLSSTVLSKCWHKIKQVGCQQLHSLFWFAIHVTGLGFTQQVEITFNSLFQSSYDSNNTHLSLSHWVAQVTVNERRACQVGQFLRPSWKWLRGLQELTSINSLRQGSRVDQCCQSSFAPTVEWAASSLSVLQLLQCEMCCGLYKIKSRNLQSSRSSFFIRFNYHSC